MLDTKEICEILETEQRQLLNGNAKLNADRLSALELFRKIGLPDSKTEDWRYNNLSFIRNGNWKFSTSASNSLLSEIEARKKLFPNAHQLVLLNGVFQTELSSKIVNGLLISSLKDSFKTDALIQSKETINPFEELNKAVFNSGLFVEIDASYTLDTEIHIIHAYNNNEPFWCNDRLRILAHKNSNARIIESYLAGNVAETFCNQYAEIILEENALLEWSIIQNFENQFYHINNTRVREQANATFTMNTISIAGKFIRNNLNVTYEGENCNCFLNGLFYVNGQNVCDNHLSVDHCLPNSQSNQLYKGIMDEEGTGIFNGKIFVRKDAQKTNAYQSNKNILLSKTATINSKPQLEIFADDVKCSHGATSGYLDKNAQFYLMSRGIDEKSAIALLTYAFASEIIEKISITDAREYCDTLIKTAMNFKG